MTKVERNEATFFTAIFSTAAYFYSVASLVSWWLFLVPNKFLPTSVADLKLYSLETSPVATSAKQACWHNIGAIVVFGFFHSLLARKSVKQWMDLPETVERPCYCLQGAFLLHMVQHHWVDVQGVTVWNFSGFSLVSDALLCVFWLGAIVLLSATFALDHFHLFGLSQGFGMDINKMLGLGPPAKGKRNGGALVTRWHYKLVAHPTMTGVLMNLWATPVMTFGRLGYALFNTAYVVMAVLRFEERSIREDLGAEYDKYLETTPRFFPHNPISGIVRGDSRIQARFVLNDVRRQEEANQEKVEIKCDLILLSPCYLISRLE